jgi:hypothetical protein
MRKILDVESLDAKIGAPVRETVTEVRTAAAKAGRAAESQATLNIALTAVAVCALLVAVLVVRDVRGAAR